MAAPLRWRPESDSPSSVFGHVVLPARLRLRHYRGDRSSARSARWDDFIDCCPREHPQKTLGELYLNSSENARISTGPRFLAGPCLTRNWADRLIGEKGPDAMWTPGHYRRYLRSDQWCAAAKGASSPLPRLCAA